MPLYHFCCLFLVFLGGYFLLLFKEEFCPWGLSQLMTPHAILPLYRYPQFFSGSWIFHAFSNCQPTAVIFLFGSFSSWFAIEKQRLSTKSQDKKKLNRIFCHCCCDYLTVFSLLLWHAKTKACHSTLVICSRYD